MHFIESDITIFLNEIYINFFLVENVINKIFLIA